MNVAGFTPSKILKVKIPIRDRLGPRRDSSEEATTTAPVTDLRQALSRQRKPRGRAEKRHRAATPEVGGTTRRATRSQRRLASKSPKPRSPGRESSEQYSDVSERERQRKLSLTPEIVVRQVLHKAPRLLSLAV